MQWNWQLSEWPKFSYNRDLIIASERQYLLKSGSIGAFLKNIGENHYTQFAVEILAIEGQESSKIEGEILDRVSLQSSIQEQFGLKPPKRQERQRESRMASLLCSVYESYERPLSHEMLFQWHQMLFDKDSGLNDIGRYRTHVEPMQIVSHRYDSLKVFFQAPPSSQVLAEMNAFIEWFNSSSYMESVLARAALAHVYFESIHPFEDGNGRLGRVLVEKILSQAVGQPVLIAVSKVLEKRKKEYYAALEKCNSTLNAESWVLFFAEVILQAQEESMALLTFLIEKSKLLNALQGELNPRQEKVLLRMFAEGLQGFKGGLSAENYISITKTSRATATRDLIDLVEKKALLKTGELRHTRYWLNLPKSLI